MHIISRFKNIVILLLVPVLSAVLFTTCERSDVAPSLSVSETTVPYAAGSTTVSVTASGNWLLAVYFDAGVRPWATLSTGQGEGSRDGIVLEYDENSSEDARTAKIVLTAGATDVIVTFTQAGNSSDPGPGPDPDPDPDPDPEPAAIPEWLELPEVVQDADRHFYSHDMTLRGRTCRNYSFLWDRDNLLAHWVAYPLNDGLIGDGDRTDDWGYDPLVPIEEQPTLFSGYRGGYDRGHQLPSADRYTDNESTFYFTNMTPQLGRLNQNIWRKFEEKVRVWAGKSDTLYVVTGCVLDGSLGKAYDNDGKAVTVPGGYFKALLRYQQSSTVGYGGYVAAGFFLEHRGYSEASVTRDMCMSIDELEELTGLDFFVNLKKKYPTIADMVEAQDPDNVNFWWN